MKLADSTLMGVKAVRNSKEVITEVNLRSLKTEKEKR